MSLSIIVASAVAGCAGVFSTAHFASSSGRISFDYSAAWHARTYPMPAAPFSTVPVWLSPQRMHAPCMTRYGPYHTTITCGQPISHIALSPGVCGPPLRRP